MNLQDIGKLIEEELDDKDSVREIAIKSSRDIIRKASKIIVTLHHRKDCSEDLRSMKEEVWHLKSLLIKDHPDLYYAGFVQNALQEYTEAIVFRAIIYGEDIPSHRDLNVNPAAYIMGLADVVGELRREVLEFLRREDFVDAERFLSIMEDIYETLLVFNYPSGLVPIKQKQDVARSLVEKTRGEITIASMNRKLKEDIERLISESNRDSGANI